MTESNVSKVKEIDLRTPKSPVVKLDKDRFAPSAILGPLAVLVGFVAVWYVVAYNMGERKRNAVIPYPHVVITEFFGGGPAGEQPLELLSATWITFLAAFSGLGISMILGLLFAASMSQFLTLERAFYPYAVILQTIPVLALVPFIGLLFGYGMFSRVLVCVIISLFPVITNTLFGLKAVDTAQHDLFTLHNSSRFQRLMKLEFPSALPAIFTGFQIAAGLAVIGSIVGGLFFQQGSTADLGRRIREYATRVRPAEMFCAVILSALMGVIFFQFFGWAGKRLTGHWYKGEKS